MRWFISSDVLIKQARATRAVGVDGHGGPLRSEQSDYPMSSAQDHRSERVNGRGEGSYIRTTGAAIYAFRLMFSGPVSTNAG